MTVQLLFLVSMLAGVACLVAAMAVARLRWRGDIAPFSRRTSEIDVLVHPASYAVESAVARIRALTFAGCALVAIAVGCLAYQALRDIGK